MLSDHLLRASTNLVHSTIVRMEYKNGILRTVLVRECNTDGYCTSVLYCTTAVFLRSDHLNDLIDGRGGAPRPFSLNLLPAQSHHRQVDIFPVADKRHGLPGLQATDSMWSFRSECIHHSPSNQGSHESAGLKAHQLRRQRFGVQDPQATRCLFCLSSRHGWAQTLCFGA
jgi:hypothetical protein